MEVALPSFDCVRELDGRQFGGIKKGERWLLLSYHVSTSFRPHPRGVNSVGGNVAPVSGTISPSLSLRRQRHFPVQNDMRGGPGVRVVGIERARPILPNESVGEAFFLQFVFPFLLLVPRYIILHPKVQRGVVPWDTMQGCRNYFITPLLNNVL